MKDQQAQWDAEDATARLLSIESARAALEALEREQAALRLRLRRIPRLIDEAKWKLAEAIRLAVHHARQREG